MLQNLVRSAVYMSDDRLIFQKVGAGEDDHIWLADLTTDSLEVLVRIPERSRLRFAGGMVAGGRAVLVLRSARELQLRFFDGERVEQQRRWTGSIQGPKIERRLVTPERTVFLLRLVPAAREGTNALLALEEEGIETVAAAPGLFDADVSPDEHWIAINRWQDGQRMIVIDRLMP